MKAKNPNDYKQSIKALSDVLNFGKHKGQTVEWVIDNDPGYLLWCRDEKVAKFTEEILNYVDDAEDANRWDEEEHDGLTHNDILYRD